VRRDRLRRRGFKVDTAPNGAHGLDRFIHCAYSLVLLDLMMPVMSGYEFLERLERMNPSHRPLVIVLTAGAARAISIRRSSPARSTNRSTSSCW